MAASYDFEAEKRRGNRLTRGMAPIPYREDGPVAFEEVDDKVFMGKAVLQEHKRQVAELERHLQVMKAQQQQLQEPSRASQALANLTQALHIMYNALLTL